MAPKRTQKTETAPVATPAPAAPVEEKQLVQEEEEHEDESDSTTEQDKKARTRRTVNKETFFQSLTELLGQIDGEVSKLSEQREKPKGLRFLKRVRKALHVVESDARKVLKFKNAAKKSGSMTGFMKPVFISEEMASFTGLDKNTPYPRPQITSAICKYIETHNLQNPKDRREFSVDGALQKLLRYNPAQPPVDEQGNAIPMTYFRLQKYMHHHFHAGDATATASTPTPAPVAETPAPQPVAATPAPVATAAASKRKAK
jgi:chromatin remodeling complex protein RSC6